MNSVSLKPLPSSRKQSGQQCFHCGLPISKGIDLGVEIDGARRPMCCRGCQAVAQAIVNGGQAAFYRHRTTQSITGREPEPEFLARTAVFDLPAVQQSFVTTTEGSVREAHLIMEGIVCAACVWLNENYLRRLTGVQSININYATRRAWLRWDNERIQLSEILGAIARIGYTAHPYDPHRQQQLLEAERKRYLWRLGIAGILGMQVMMIAVVLYAGDWFGMEAEFRGLFLWVSLVFTAPVLVFAGQPFFSSAWRDLRRCTVGMDVPVALAILIAFVASAIATITGTGAVYYDSVVMFVFFLLTARFLELSARKRATEALDAIALRVPATATRLDNLGEQRVVPVAELRPGDRVLIRPGGIVPADGVVVSGRSSVDQSLISGESLPVLCCQGERVVGGSINVESPLEMLVDHVGETTVLSEILRLMERAQMEKPAVVSLTDRAASWFVAAVLLLSVVVAITWYFVDATRWLPVTIAVLVVSCPCALALATPAAVTAATGRLAAMGLLVTRGHALEALASSTHVIFDKTGTLTEGRLSLIKTVTFADLGVEECLRRAAALERFSEHPIAAALLEAAGELGPMIAQQATVEPGAGIQARINGFMHYMGTPAFLAQHTKAMVDPEILNALECGGGTLVFLSSEHTLLAGFVFQDTVRPDAAELVMRLKSYGRQVMLLSGDQRGAVQQVAGEVAIDHFAWGLTPGQKLSAVQELQQNGAVVAMVGDGVNDAPVLAQAQVSIAMGSGAPLAAASADILLVSGRIRNVAEGLRIALAARRVIRQNLSWAVAYNLLAIPAAAMGIIQPWMAAIGMSASSILVVANSLRLCRESGWK